MPHELILYTGPHCELCDHALDVIAQLPDNAVNVKSVNIRNSTELYHLYGARIPVIKRVDSSAELGWPFDLEALETFLI
ncbi:glutaredoxin family protein [Glaciecola sp. XM2]|nr:glutaredoxin family protein [Glaciecola sp. XM2]